jgi:hypothetical protein
MVSVTYSVCIKRSSGFILRVRPGVCLSTPTMIFFNAAWHGYLDVNNISHHRERLPPIQLTFKRGFKQLHHKSWLDSLLKILTHHISHTMALFKPSSQQKDVIQSFPNLLNVVSGVCCCSYFLYIIRNKNKLNLSHDSLWYISSFLVHMEGI